MTAPFADVVAAFARGDNDAVLRLTETMLVERPGDDAAHEMRARALLALGRLGEADSEAGDAVRLDPEEIRYRELLAEILRAQGAHRDAAVEFAELARHDPAQSQWTLAEAQERLAGAQPGMGVEAANRAVRLEPRNGRAQLTLSQALARTGDARGALKAAVAAMRLLGGSAEAREALADAEWLSDQDEAAFTEFRALSHELEGPDRDRVVSKARTLYRQRAGWSGRLMASAAPLFSLAFRLGWISVRP